MASRDEVLFELQRRVEQNELDAQRYRKLKDYFSFSKREDWNDLWVSYKFLDSAVDALPEDV